MTKILGILCFAVSMGATGAVTAGDDVGLINHLTGDISYTSAGTAAKARPFMKIRAGDKFSVPSGAQMRVVYFDGGRQESFSGPAGFTAGAKQSTVQSGSQPQVVVLPSGVSQKIAQTPELIQIAKLGRSGGVAVRGTGTNQRLTPQQEAEVRQARQTYDQLRKSAAADDITPELYLYSVLQDHLMYSDMKQVVAEMQKRQPKSPDVAAMVEYVKVRSEAK
jgi:hypothetical protein